MKPNRPTPEGRELGTEIARLCDAAIAADTRCTSCAFRAGTVPNGCLSTLMTAVKCLVEGETFYCHEADEVCAGWQACFDASDGAPVAEAPWEFPAEVTDLNVAAYRQEQAGARLSGSLFAEVVGT